MRCSWNYNDFIIWHFLSISQFYILLNGTVQSVGIFFFLIGGSVTMTGKKETVPYLSLLTAGVKEAAIWCWEPQSHQEVLEGITHRLGLEKKKSDFHSLGSAENKPIDCPGHLYMGKRELQNPTTYSLFRFYLGVLEWSRTQPKQPCRHGTIAMCLPSMLTSLLLL